MLIRRSPINRSFGAVLALWLAVFQAEPAALHSCAMHSAHGAAPAAGPVAAAPVAHDHAHHQMVPAHDAPPAQDHSGNQCTCPGGCCAAAAVALPNVTGEFSVEVAVPTGQPPRAIVRVRATIVDFVLPFANGPPAQV